MKEIILVDNSNFHYKGITYTKDDIKEKIGKKVKFILLNENIIVKSFEDISKINYNFIDEIIKIEYWEDDEILTDYDYCKRLKRLYLYSIGNGNLLYSVSKKVNELSVEPIQFYAKNSLPKKFKRITNYILVIMIDKSIYYIEVLYNCIVKSYIERNVSNISNKISNYNDNQILLIDKSVEQFIDRNIKESTNLTIINIGGKINEQIYKA